jgi:hypothetical protein
MSDSVDAIEVLDESHVLISKINLKHLLTRFYISL